MSIGHGIWDLGATDRKAVAALVREHGEQGAGERLGLSRQTVARILAGLPVRRGTTAQVRAVLGALEAKP